MPNTSRNIREVFLLQLAIVSLVLLLYLVVDQILDDALASPWVIFFAVSTALAAVVAATWNSYRATKRLMAPMNWLLREVARWDPQSPDTEAFSPDRIPANVQGNPRKMADALHQLGERLDAFVARERDFTRDASHELRTPLTVIRVAADLISSDEGLSDLSRRSLGRIQNANASMESLMDALLLLARDRSVALETEDFSVREIVEGELAKVKPLLDEKNVALAVHLDADPHLHAPPRVLGVMLGNLLSNAARFTDSGEIRLHLKEDRIEVVDTGIGMNADALARAFEPFYRADVAHAGSGLGLSIAHRLGQRCGWPLQLESAPGKGTKATILLRPCVQS
ncbi:MAG: HAMP domain-containing sensor histidine kinase [Pseudomonadota bacterium]